MKVLRIVLIATLLAAQGRGNPGSWSSSGPTGGLVYSIAVDPTNSGIIYAGTQVGIFKSADGGASWAISSTGLPTRGRPAYSLAVSSSDPSTVYAGTVYAGVFKSTDAGAMWASVNSGLPDHAGILSLAVDPSSPSTVYAGGAGLYKSTDGGASWGHLAGGLPTASGISSIAIDPSLPDTLYVGTIGGSGSFKSTDGGSTWSMVAGGLSSCLVHFAVNPSVTTTVYAAGGCGFARSTDGGASWSTTLSAELSTLAADPSDGSNVFVAGFFGAGVYRSTDAGETWDFLGVPDHYIRSMAVAPAPVGALLLGSFGCGVLESFDAGSRWAPSNAGLVNTYVNALAVDPSDPRTVYSGKVSAGYDVCAGLSKSTDGGLSWGQSDLSEQSIYSLAIDPSDPRTIYAGTGGNINLLKTTDGGRSWTRPRPGYPGAVTSELVIDPLQPRTLYAVAADYISSQHVFRSTDGGNNWERRDGGLPIQSHFQLLDLAISSSQMIAGRWLLAATSAGMFRSNDEGRSWQASGIGLPRRVFASSVVISPADPRVVYAGVGFSGVYRSTDGGQSWQPANRGFPALAWVQSLVIDPLSPTTVYAGTFGVVNDADSTLIGKVYRTINGGFSWEEMNAGMPETSINRLAIDSKGIALHAATQGNGVRDLTIPRPAAARARQLR